MGGLPFGMFPRLPSAHARREKGLKIAVASPAGREAGTGIDVWGWPPQLPPGAWGWGVLGIARGQTPLVAGDSELSIHRDLPLTVQPLGSVGPPGAS